MCIGPPLAAVPHPGGGGGWGWGWGCWQSRHREEQLQLQGEMVRFMPMSTNPGGLDCRKKAAINQQMVQARRLSVAAGPETGLSWSVPRSPACAQHHGSLLAKAHQLAVWQVLYSVHLLRPTQVLQAVLVPVKKANYLFLYWLIQKLTTVRCDLSFFNRAQHICMHICTYLDLHICIRCRSVNRRSTSV